MTAQTHRIKRQILELKVPREDQAQRLYADMRRIHHQRIIPLMDRFFAEASDPDRILRIDSLDLDLGTVDPDDLELGLVAKLSKALPKALGNELRGRERLDTRPGAGSRERSGLELFVHAARTGTLPWWADGSQPRLLEDTLEGLVRDAPTPLARMMRKLSQEPRSLERIVLLYDDENLSALCRLMAPHLEPSQEQFPQELTVLLQKSKAVTGKTETRIRNRVWIGILRTAGLKGKDDRKPLAFWREVLVRIALESGATYTTLLSSIHSWMQVEARSMPGHFRHITETLFEELPEAPAETEELTPELVRLQNPEGPLSDLSAMLRPVADRLPDALKTELLDTLKSQGDNASEDDAVRGIVQAVRRAIERDVLPWSVIRQWLADLRKQPASGLPLVVLSQLSEMLRKAIRDELIPQSREEKPPVDLSFSETDTLYVENAGLVILWPFIELFFEHLGLLEEKQFRDAAAAQRAVGLLQYLATEDPAPHEYLLPLNKVLCGMALTEVFDFGPPVTRAEAEEGTNLLDALIANAPILKNITLPGFRGSFLIRKGSLETRDGAWLLRVERESYDVVLDRFPWTVNWVKLPWMEAPLRVEW